MARRNDIRKIDAADFPRRANRIAQFNFLTRYAMLAASSHNSQPWLFKTRDYRLHLFADLSRWVQVADPDQRELHISIGCALENVLIAAAHFGYACDVEYFPDPAHSELVARVDLAPAAESLHYPELFGAITMRSTDRRRYLSTPLSFEDVRQLSVCCREGDGVSLELRSDRLIKAHIDDVVHRADLIRFGDPAYRKELGRCIGQGAFGTPRLAARIEEMVISRLNVGCIAARRDSAALRSSPFVGLLSSARNDRISQVKVGQVFERIALRAAQLSIRLQPMSQALEIAELRPLVGIAFGTIGIPQHLFRVGYAPAGRSRTPRRRLEEAWA